MRSPRLVIGLSATALVLTSWASPVRSVDASDSSEVVRLAVLTDDNQDRPGGLDVTTVVTEADRVDDVIEDLDRESDVVSVEVDRRVRLAADPYASGQYGPSRVRANLVRGELTGDGVTVAVIDSGVAADHPDLATPLPGDRPRVLPGTTFLIPDPGAPNLTGTPATVDPNGHGTHVAGILAAADDNGIGVAGIAPDAQVLPVRVLDSSGFGWASDVAQGILWAHEQGADVINLSLAGPYPSEAIEAAVEFATTDTTRGTPPTVVVAAAGNAGTAHPRMYPASVPGVIAVASTDAGDNVASTSSRGSFVDLAAPGVSVVSTCPAGAYCYRSGTSMASPLVAGAAALLLEQDSSRTPAAIETILEGSAFDSTAVGFDNDTGWGRLDLAAALAPDRFPKVPRPVRLPSGSFVTATAGSRSIQVGGTASDPDGNPSIRLEVTLEGRRSTRTTPASGGRWSLSFSTGPGTSRICVSVLDVPTNQAVSAGCRNVVVK